MAALRSLCLPALLTLLGGLGCVKDTTGGTTLYVYDGGTSSVLVWNDVNDVYNAQQKATTIPAANRTITSDLLSGITLAWGGLTVDNNSNRLYLVTEAGVVWVITKASTQNGSISNTSDITNFNLGAPGTDPYSGGSVFEQACVDGSSNTLFVTETAADGSATRIWKITNASTVAQTYGPGYTFTPAATYTIGTGTDTFGCGVAAIPGGNAYGLMGNGAVLYNGLGTTSYTGARVRATQSGIFNPLTYITTGGVLIGPATDLGSPLQYGGLGFDSQNNVLYVFAPDYSSPTDASILVYNKSLFTAGLNQPPTRTLGDVAGALGNLRTIAHPANSDWLLGANFTLTTGSAIGEGSGGADLLIWKSPSAGGAALSAGLPGVTEIRGMAIGGTD
jgi:hypothetical protein